MPIQVRGKFRRYTHSKTEFEHNGIKVKIAENGKVTISKEGEDSDAPVEDVIENIPAIFFFKIVSILRATRKVSYEDEPIRKN